VGVRKNLVGGRKHRVAAARKRKRGVKGGKTFTFGQPRGGETKNGQDNPPVKLLGKLGSAWLRKNATSVTGVLTKLDLREKNNTTEEDPRGDGRRLNKRKEKKGDL